MTKSYTFNGNIETSYESWEQWINNAYTICDILGYEINYYDFSVMGKISGKIHPISGMRRKLTNIQNKEDTIKGMSLIVLPKEYESAAFDYIITLARNKNYVTLVINQEYGMNIDETAIIKLLRRNITPSSGEIYEMDIYECPEFYAAKANAKEYFKSLKVVEYLK